MLFFCVQSYDVSSVLLNEIRQYYPDLWLKVVDFQKGVFKNLQSYYQIGIDIEIFTKKATNLFIKACVYFNLTTFTKHRILRIGRHFCIFCVLVFFQKK